MPSIRRAQSKASAAPTRIFLGSHPRSEQVPPNGLESTIATFHPAARHRDATVDAAEPVPIATRSNFFVMSFSQRSVRQQEYLQPSAPLLIDNRSTRRGFWQSHFNGT